MAKSRHAVPSKTIFEARGWRCEGCQKAVSEALLEPLRGVGRPDRQTKAKLVCYDAVLGKSCRCCRIGAARAV